jgi:hypothetical protein
MYAHMAATYRLTYELQQQYPNHLPLTDLLQWGTFLTMNANSVIPDAILAKFPRDMYIVIPGLQDKPSVTQMARHATHPTDKAPHNIVRSLHFLYNPRPVGIGYIPANTLSTKLHPHTQ